MKKKIENLARKLRHEHMTRSEIKRYLRADDDETRSVIKFFREHFDLKQDGRGHNSHYYIRSKFDDNAQYVISPATKREKWYRWIALSDTHFGTRQTDVEGLEACLEAALNEGYEHVYFSGDLCDGNKVYKGQLNNLTAFTQEDQVKEAVRCLDQFPLHYRMIGGNHDYSWEEQGAPNPCKSACSQLSKAEFLGVTRADVLIGGVLMRLVHGAGGNAYAKSYPGQTYLRNVFEGGQDYGIWFGGDITPLQILQIGHYHTKLNYNAYGVEVIHPGNFQRGNDFTERRGLRGPRGLYLIDMWAKNGLITKLQPTFVFSPTNHSRT